MHCEILDLLLICHATRKGGFFMGRPARARPEDWMRASARRAPLQAPIEYTSSTAIARHCNQLRLIYQPSVSATLGSVDRLRAFIAHAKNQYTGEKEPPGANMRHSGGSVVFDATKGRQEAVAGRRWCRIHTADPMRRCSKDQGQNQSQQEPSPLQTMFQ